MELAAVRAFQLPYEAGWQMPMLLVLATGLLFSFLSFVFRGRSGGEGQAVADTKEVPREARQDREHKVLSVQDTEDCLRRLGAPSHAHEEGTFVPSNGLLTNNTPEAAAFENELCRGRFLSIHRATNDKKLDKSGDYPYGDYFKGKSRLWEARMQFKFKVPPKSEDLYFGVEIAEYVPMAAAAKRTLQLAVRALKGVVGSQTYHTVGDDPATTEGPLERPAFVMPLWAFDQIIVTPEGDLPPKLNDPDIPNMGSKRYQRVKEYQEELEQLEFKVGPTYTMCFWGISRFLDKLNWQLRLPLSPMPVCFNTFCGRPPVHVVVYSLKPAAEAGDTRHLQSRKNYYFNLAFWSSRHRPAPKHLEDMLSLSQMKPSSRDPVSSEVRGRRLEHWHAGKGNFHKRALEWVSCCAPFVTTHF